MRFFKQNSLSPPQRYMCFENRHCFQKQDVCIIAKPNLPWTGYRFWLERNRGRRSSACEVLVAGIFVVADCDGGDGRGGGIF